MRVVLFWEDDRGTRFFAAGFPDPVSSRAKPSLPLRLSPLDEGVRENPAALLWGMAMEAKRTRAGGASPPLHG